MDLLNIIGTGSQLQETQWNQNIRREDMAWRAKEAAMFAKEEQSMEGEHNMRMLEQQWRKQDNKRRQVDVRAAEFEQISQLSALIAGFAMVAMVELNLPSDLELWVVVSYGLATSLTVGASLMAMLTATFGNILLYKSHREAEHDAQRAARRNVNADDEWIACFSWFRWGVTGFLVVMGLTGWITFAPTAHRISGAIVVSGVAGIFAILWAHLRFSYSSYLSRASVEEERRDNVMAG